MKNKNKSCEISHLTEEFPEKQDNDSLELSNIHYILFVPFVLTSAAVFGSPSSLHVFYF